MVTWGQPRVPDGGGETGVEEDVETQARGRERQAGLFPEDAQRTDGGAHGLGTTRKLGRSGARSAAVSRFVKTKYSFSRSSTASAASTRRR